MLLGWYIRLFLSLTHTLYKLGGVEFRIAFIQFAFGNQYTHECVNEKYNAKRQEQFILFLDRIGNYFQVIYYFS